MSEFLSKILFSVGNFSKNLNGPDSLTGSVMVSEGNLLFLFFFLIIFLSALSFGKTRIVLALLATYLAAFLESIFWYRVELAKIFGDFLKLPAIFWSRLAVLAIFFIITFLILNRSILKPKMSLQESPPTTILFLSILQGIFWLTILISFLPAGHSVFSEYSVAAKYLNGSAARFIWAFVSLLALLFLKHKKAA